MYGWLVFAEVPRNKSLTLFCKVCQLLGMKKIQTAYHPQSKGMLESFNWTLLDQLATFVEHHQMDYD